ncbi:MAG: MBL fold metallo-hydrolase [Bacteroidales bacterium]|nr:MBL fold metallo-hydrolase [Bacteroidales bacterium]MDD4216877.1 MBL fold metallo-hydrolase [Bacteroidales bacterium]MDY0143079.1 MBL fold metallo-hydrolase [Bacteroidales bacterium]
MKIRFIGATHEVTGSKHLITTDAGKKILLDCGMFQGKGKETDSSNRDLGFEPREIDHIILTHAHIDHSGLIPYLYTLGFEGSVICTDATRNLCSLMLPDSGFIQEHDNKWYNKKLAKKGLPTVKPIYTHEDAVASMKLFISVAINRKFKIDENITVQFTNAGHMLGSAVANVSIKENGKITKIAYTGDVGRPTNRIVKPPAPFPQADILITESTYGDRIHDSQHESEDALLKVVIDTCVNKGGKLIIPSFSVGRTQEIVLSLNNWFNQDRLPRIDIYVDSPLSVNVTEVFRMHPECYNKNLRQVMESDSDPFGFERLHYIKHVNDSKRLNKTKKPCVIISASGMAEAGRVKHHIANSIDDHKNTILIVGYCAPTTLGARLQQGDAKISIFGVEHYINAEIKRLESFSGHGDYVEMADFLECQNKDELSKIFLVHGDIKAAEHYKKHLQKRGFKNIEIPERDYEITI